MTTMQQNRFQQVITDVQGAPANQRPKKLIEAVAQVMQNSSNPQIQQWGQELESIEPQLVDAMRN